MDCDVGEIYVKCSVLAVSSVTEGHSLTLTAHTFLCMFEINQYFNIFVRVNSGHHFPLSLHVASKLATCVWQPRHFLFPRLLLIVHRISNKYFLSHDYVMPVHVFRYSPSLLLQYLTLCCLTQKARHESKDLNKYKVYTTKTCLL